MAFCLKKVFASQTLIAFVAVRAQLPVGLLSCFFGATGGPSRAPKPALLWMLQEFAPHAQLRSRALLS